MLCPHQPNRNLVRKWPDLRSRRLRPKSLSMSHRRHEPIDETDTRSVSPSRLTVAREFRALTRKELAEKVGVSPSAITRFETSDCGIESQRAERLSGALDFPI